MRDGVLNDASDARRAAIPITGWRRILAILLKSSLAIPAILEDGDPLACAMACSLAA